MLCSVSKRRTAERRTAFTLVEVVAGLVLMAGLLVATVRATTIHKRQLRLAADRVAAADVADDLLESSRGRLVVGRRSRVPGHPNWTAVTSQVGQQRLLGQPLVTIRLAIVRDAGPGGEQPVTLVAVDVLQPAEEVR